MTTETSITPTQELTPQAQVIVDKAKSELGEERVPPLPKIKVSYDGEAAEEGGFFLSIFDPETNEKRTVDIGKEPVVTILKRTVSYSVYNDQDDKLELMTNEIPEENGWLIMNTPTWLLRLHPNKAIEFYGTYKEFTQWRKENYTDSKGRPELKYKNVIYVYFEHPEGHPDNIYQMYASAASASGEMNDPHPDHHTFESFRTKLRSSELGVYFGTECKLSTIERGGAEEKNKKDKKIRYFLINFDPASPSDINKMADIYSNLEHSLEDKHEKMFVHLPTEPKVLSAPKAESGVVDDIEELFDEDK